MIRGGSAALLLGLARVASADVAGPIVLPELAATNGAAVSLLVSRIDAEDEEGSPYRTNLAIIDAAATWAREVGAVHLAVTAGLPMIYVGPTHATFSRDPETGMFVGNPRFGTVASVRSGALVLGVGADGYLGVATHGARAAAARLYADPARTWPEASVGRLHVDARVESGAAAAQLELAVEGWRPAAGPRTQLLVRAGASVSVGLAARCALILDATSYTDALDEMYDEGVAATLALDAGLRFRRGRTAITVRASIPVAPEPFLALGVDVALAL
jgi:hypothetical protein